MKRTLYYISWAMTIVILTTSCVTLQPTASHVSDADYNQRIVINHPEYKKKRSAMGYVVEIGLPILGGIAGYAVDPYVMQTSEGQKSAHVGGVFLGALVGTGVSYLSNVVGQYGSSRIAIDKQKWVEKAFGNNYYILDSFSGYLRIINNAAEHNYTVKNIGDVSDFSRAFPGSRNSEKIVAQAVSRVKRDDLPRVLELYPNTEYAERIKARFIYESPSFNELTEALEKYPRPKSEVEELYASLVANATEAIAFHQIYPNSKFNKTVVCNAFNTKATASDLRKLSDVYGTMVNFTQADLQGASDIIRRNYYLSLRDLTTYTSMSQLDSFNEKYSWLTFWDKKYDIVSMAWETADKLYSQGNDVIEQAGKIVTKDYARKAGVDVSYFNGFVNERLKEQFQKVSILSTYYIASKSEEFEKWKSAAHAAALVKMDGNPKFLIYGVINNSSKFDMPIKLSGHCDVYLESQYEGDFGQLINALSLITKTPNGVRGKLTSLTYDNFLIPSLVAGQSMPYAILLTLPDKINGVKLAGGYNVADILKLSLTLTLDNIKVFPHLTDKAPSQEQLANQNAWLNMAVNGMPDVETIDLIRNEVYKQSHWDAKWARLGSGYSYSASSSSKKEIEIDVETVKLSDFSYTVDEEWGSNPADDIMKYQRKTVRFKDRAGEYRGDFFREYNNPNSDIWLQRGADSYYYDSLENLIISLYTYKKYGKFRKTGRK